MTTKKTEEKEVQEVDIDTDTDTDTDTADGQLTVFREDDPGDAVMRASIALPAYESISDKKVQQEIRDLFGNQVEISTDVDFSKKFNSFDALAEFTTECDKDLKRIEVNTKSQNIRYSGGLMARRWYLGFVIAQTLDNASYGTDTSGKLAAKMGISKSYLHQLKDVGKRLTLKDAYVLGMYDASWASIRALATIKDAGTRKQLIVLFTQSIKDWNNERMRMAAKASFSAAIEAAKKGDMDIDTTNPTELPVSNCDDIERLAPEFAEANKLLTKLRKSLVDLSNEGWHDRVTDAFEACFVPSSLPGAETELRKFVAMATEVKDMMTTMSDLMPDLKDQVISLENLTITPIDPDGNAVQPQPPAPQVPAAAPKVQSAAPSATPAKKPLDKKKK